MKLLELARQRRGSIGRDEITKIAGLILDLESEVEEYYESIRGETLFGADPETGLPVAVGFRSQSKVEWLEESIAAKRATIAEATTILERIEAAYADYDLPPMSMEDLQGRIDALEAEPARLITLIHHRIHFLMRENPGVTLPMIFGDVEIQTLEQKRGEAATEGNRERARLVELKDRLIPLASEGAALIRRVRQPQILDLARVSEVLIA